MLVKDFKEARNPLYLVRLPFGKVLMFKEKKFKYGNHSEATLPCSD